MNYFTIAIVFAFILFIPLDISAQQLSVFDVDIKDLSVQYDEQAEKFLLSLTVENIGDSGEFVVNLEVGSENNENSKTYSQSVMLNQGQTQPITFMHPAKEFEILSVKASITPPLSSTNSYHVFDQIIENVTELARTWDWTSIGLGVVIGLVMKVGLELKRWPILKTSKNIIFIIIAMVLLGAYVISEENGLSENIRIFEPAKLIPAANPDQVLFGLLFAYIVAWIKEISDSHDINKKLRTFASSINKK